MKNSEASHKPMSQSDPWKVSRRFFRVHWNDESKRSSAVTNHRRTILPLPAGEGRGEGESLGWWCPAGSWRVAAVLFLFLLALNSHATTYYVDINSPSPTPPYTSWSTASTDIQSAVNQTTNGDLVLVNPGVYQTGGETVNGFALTNRVAINDAITVQSVGGPSTTFIQGNPVPGADAIRCVYMTNGATLAGFTLTNGATMVSGDLFGECSGGGVSCGSVGSIITNCVLSGNQANYDGGGAFLGTLNNCLISSNSTPSSGGGTCNSIVIACTLIGNTATDGGGADGGSLNGCTITNNLSSNYGGGAMGCALTNCLVAGNYATGPGGGAALSTLNNCVISNNYAYGTGGGAYDDTLIACLLITNSASAGGGAGFSHLTNCTLVANSSPQGDGGGSSSGTLANCTLMRNSAEFGGGTYMDSLTGCTLISNSASQFGGGSEGGALTNCTLIGNSAYYNGGGADGATLDGCTINSNSVIDQDGGGASSSALTGCTLAGNSAPSGGGAYSGSLFQCILNNNSATFGAGAFQSTLSNCTLTGNKASSGGGGANGGSLDNCAVFGNSALVGGGADASTLTNCTLTGNIASEYGGGAYSGTMNNCILFYNTAATGPNYYLGTFNYCCALPLPAGPGNISSQPQLASTSHLSANSPCRGAGSSAYANGVDIDGQAWASPPSIGCDEYYAGGSTGSVTVAILASYTNVATGFNVSFTGLITGPVNESVWNFGDGVTESNQPYASHQWQSAGSYLVTLTAFNDSYPNGIIATQEMIIGSGPCYVALTSTNPVPPYSSWDTAATNIQDAVDIAPWGGFIVVSNGIYNYGGRATSSSSSSTSTGGGSNRVTIAKAVTVQSVNGPASTFIQGYQVPGTIIGTNAIRCVWLTNGAVLSGFTLTNGATAGSNVKVDGAGGGAFSSGVISNCVLVGNIAASGAGVFGGTVNNCVLIANTTTSGGDGGGAWFANLNDCLIVSNSAPSGVGGGLGTSCNATNCTIVFNSANSGGGEYGANLANCIVYSNSGANYDSDEFTLTYCCTTPLPSLTSGTRNFTNAPAFVNAAIGNFHLQSSSPCINSGNNAYVANATDLDGNPRIVGGTVDIGAYEYQTPTSVISYAYLQQYKLSPDGSVDFKDLDGTAFNVYQDWIAGLNPTNPASVLAMLTPVTTNTATGVTVKWQSVSGIPYFLQRSTNLPSQPPFSTIQSNITGLRNTNTTSYTDTSATNNVPYFYRVGVIAP